MYEYEMGVGKDMDRANYWHKKSSEQGFNKAQNRLRNFIII